MSGFLHIPILIGTIAFVLAPCGAMAGGPPQPLTSCNTSVESDVYLTADLDCTGVGGMGVNLTKRATLELRGFSILNATDIAVQCHKNCTVVGPGSLTGNHIGIWAPFKATVVEVDLIDNAVLGIASTNLTMTGSSIVGSQTGIMGGKRVTLTDSSVTGSAFNGVEVAAYLPFGADSCSHGKLRLYNSTVSGNNLVDLVTCREPIVDETSSCETSAQSDTGAFWGVCSLY